MEQCYIKSSKLFYGALVLFVIKRWQMNIPWLSCFKQNYHKKQLPFAFDWWLVWLSTWGSLLQLIRFEVKLLSNSHRECKYGKDGHGINMTFMNS